MPESRIARQLPLSAVALAALFASASAQTPLPQWEECEFRLEQMAQQAEFNQSHSILDILDGRFPQQFPPAETDAPVKFMQLLNKASPEVQAYYESFDLSTEGYTAIVPSDTFRNTSNNDVPTDTFLSAGIDPATLSEEDATKIALSHIFEGTFRYNDVLEQVNTTGEYIITSLSGYEWTFTFASLDNTFIVLRDPKAAASALPNDTSTFYNVRLDVNNVDGNKCPNTVIQVEGFIVDPADVDVEAAPPPVDGADDDDDLPTGPAIFTPDPPAPDAPDAPDVAPTAGAWHSLPVLSLLVAALASLL